MKAILTVGISASGKTTETNKFIAARREAGEKWVNVNRDDIRKSQGLPALGSPEQERLVTEIQNALIEGAAHSGANVVVSNTNLDKNHRNKLVKLLHRYGYDVSFWTFETALEECIRRDSNREASVGEEVIRKQHSRFINLDRSSLQDQPAPRWDEVLPHNYLGKTSVYVFDLDGTLALHNRSPYDYDSLHTDDVNNSVATILQDLRHDLPVWKKIIFVSGRPDSHREQTVRWIMVNLGINEPELYMRKAGDDRADYVIKNEIYDNELLPYYNIIAAFDDRDQVVYHLRKRGIPVMQVNYGRF